MMKVLYFSILIIFISLSLACSHYSLIGEPVTFKTPFGYIHKGDSMADVVTVLGNPHEVSHYKRREIWHYDFNDNGKIFIYFTEGDVAEVKLRESR